MRDHIAEHAVLGAVMLNAIVAGPMFLVLNPEEFSEPHDQALASLLGDMLRRGEHIDQITVSSEVMSRGIFPQKLTPTYLNDVTRFCLSPVHCDQYAAQVRDTYRFRQAQRAAAGMVSRIDDQGTDVSLADLDDVIDANRRALDLIPEPLGRTTAAPPMTVDELLQTESTFDWLIPGLLERGERLMLTGQEGMGKSVLLRQLAASLAAGLHPFTGHRISNGCRVLHIDAENGMGQSRRGYSQLRYAINKHDAAPGWEKRLMVVPRPDGLDLTGTDRAWWDRTCAAAAPDVIVTGPIYRLFLGNPNSEEDVRKLVAVLDGSRVRHNAAMLLEAHAGHGSNQPGVQRQMRPAGASLWLRWPENGLGLRRSKQDDGGDGADRATIADVVRWRMSREDRAWPYTITHTKHGLPWGPYDNRYDGTLESIRGTAP